MLYDLSSGPSNATTGPQYLTELLMGTPTVMACHVPK
jgi:hypothetical protein